MNAYQKLALIALLSIAAFLRFYKLEEYPLSVNQDELSNIYDGYCIAETASDRAGEAFPMVVRGFGALDFRPALCAYITSVPIKIFGFSIYTGRLFAAVLGLISLVLLFFFARRIVDTEFAFIALLIATFSPWHIIYSRLAHEGAILPPFFIILILFLWSLAKSKDYSTYYLISLGFIIGLSVNAYQATKLSAFLVCTMIGIDILFSSSNKIKNLCLLGFPALVGALPQIIVLLKNTEQFFSRANAESIPFDNANNYFITLALNLYSNLEPIYLFFSSDVYNNLTVGRLLSIEFIFFYLGILILWKVVNKNSTIRPLHIYLTAIIVILPSVLTISNPHALRASGFSIIAPLLSASGIYFILQLLKTKPIFKQYATGTIALLILLNCSYWIYNFTNSIGLRDAGHQHFLVELSTKVKNYSQDKDSVYIERIGNQPYLYFAAFGGITPIEYQTMNKIVDQPPMAWDHFHQMGKFNFKYTKEIQRLIKHIDNKKGKLFVVMAPIDNAHLLDTVKWEDNKAYLYSFD